MTQEHPITPPPELVIEWWNKYTVTSDNLIGQFATQAARWGADQELEACCEWLNCELGTGWGHGTKLRAARRPKPTSLKQQALALISHDPENQPFLSEEGIAIIRHALESLPD